MIEEWIELYLKDLERRGYSKRSVETYQGALRHFTDFLRNEKVEHLHEISKQVFVNYQIHLFAGTSREGRPWALRTQWLFLVVLQGFLRFLIRRGQLLVNPADGVEIPRLGHRNPPRNVPSEDEVLDLIEAPDLKTSLGVRDRAILEVLYATGMRITELISLAIGDVNLDDALVHIVAGKGKKDRVVPLGKVAVKAVHRYLVRVRPRHRHARKSDVLFLSARGHKMHRGAMALRLALYVRKAGIDRPITPHSFRHACATHMLRRQASVRHIQLLLGHNSLNTTQIYTQLEIEDLKRVHARTHPRETERKDQAPPGSQRSPSRSREEG